MYQKGFALLLLMTVMASPVWAQADETIVHIEPQIIAEVPDGFFGANHRWHNHATGMWDADSGMIRAGFTETAAQLGLQTIRYPGGTVANDAWWNRMIGPVSQRPANGGAKDVNSQVTELGVDEMLSWAETQQLSVVWVINAGNGNAENAAELIYYLYGDPGSDDPVEAAWASCRAANGHEAPYSCVKRFEIGNEIICGGIAFTPGCYAGEGTGEDEDAPLEKKYAFGGVFHYEDEPACLDGDFSKAASLSTGKPQQVMMLKHGPAQTDTPFVLRVDGRRWIEVTEEGMQAALPQDRVYWVSDRQVIHFGNGVHGMIPEEGAQITISYDAYHDGLDDYCQSMRMAAERCGVEIEIYAAADSQLFCQTARDIDYDGIALHQYLKAAFNAAPLSSPQDKNAFHNESALAWDFVVPQLERMRLWLSENQPESGKQREIIVTEYGNHVLSGMGYASLSQAVLSASALMEMLKAGVPLACHHPFCENSFTGGTNAMALIDTSAEDGSLMLQTSGEAMKLVTAFTGSKLLRTEIDSMPKMEIGLEHVRNGYGLLTSGDTDALNITAGLDDEGNLLILAVNRTADRQITLRFELPGLSCTFDEAMQLYDADIMAYNTQQQPDRLRAVPCSAEFPVCTLPPCSITGLRLILENAVGDESSALLPENTV